MGVGRPGPPRCSTLAARARAPALPLERRPPRCSPSNPARLLRLARKGALTVGADADAVVLDEQGTITDVMANGTWHLRDGATVTHGTFESPGSFARHA
jgi:hypothetical protein